jgi:signal transduction histidine kinase
LTLALEFAHPVAYHLPALRASAEGAITLLSISATLLFWGQFASTRRMRDLALFSALLTFSLLELSCNALPAALNVRSGSQFAAALQLGELLVAGMLTAAASIPSSKLVLGGRRPLLAAATLAGLALAVAELGGVILGGALITPAQRPVHGIGHALGHVLTAVVVIGTAALLLDAALRFAHRARVERNDALLLLVGGAILLVVGRLYYLALPWVSPNWISSRELIRLVAFGLIAAAAVRHELDARLGTARAAAGAERLRIARDLHDGLAQDLAFIAAHGARIADDLGAEHPVAVAARHALAVSRGTISELSSMSDATSGEALEAVAGELRARFGIAIAVDADADLELPHDAREDILRIAREAIANAARHGQATHITVNLARAERGLVLRIRDDGSGIFAGASPAPAEGFGLRTMRERAAALDGSLMVMELGRGGTELEVVLP